MKFKAGERVRIVREILGLTREEFAHILGIDWVRLKSVEILTARVSEVEYEPLGETVPALIPFLIYEAKISLKALEQSDSTYCQVAASNIKINKLPKKFPIIDLIAE